MFQWHVGAPSGWLVRPLDTALGTFQVAPESRKLRCSGQAMRFPPLDLSRLKFPGPLPCKGSGLWDSRLGTCPYWISHCLWTFSVNRVENGVCG